VVDFNKHCEHRKPNLLPVSGIPIYYHRCGQCGFIFTAAFDHFSPDDFLTHIYNSGYAAVDPDYAEVRPTGNAGFITSLFGNHKWISILDYGGGNGLLGKKLQAAGFRDVVTYDPFVPEHATRPQRRFDLVVSFEVVEHSNHPHETFGEMDSLLKPDGMMLFTTLVQPTNMAEIGLSWWYVGPRNGHVSIYTRAALKSVLAARGLHQGSNNDNQHAAWRTVPEFAKGVLKSRPG
jgi:2-polyprenyl-6-hydroxyphenyl methylase/3-demethylubiquinone-9 3-methyltransferase